MKFPMGSDGKAVCVFIELRRRLGIGDDEVVEREAVMMVIAVADHVDGWDSEEPRLHPHRTAERIAAVADHEIGLEGSQNLRVLIEKGIGLVIGHFTPGC